MTQDSTTHGVGRLRIDPQRLRADIDAVNEIGRIEGLEGINRISFSDADMAGRRWLIERLEAAGLDAWIDPVGNVFGRWQVGSGPAVLAGSHLDTVPSGGAFDGTLGVLAALEGVRAMRDAGLAPVRPVEVVCTADEEGRFGGMLGSQALCGEIDAAWIAGAADDTGVPLADTMRTQGLDPSAPTPRDPGDIAVFLELHVEQGPVLERSADKIGVVTAVSGVFNWTVKMTGEANHSGTTPMDARRDAFRGLAEFGAAIERILERCGSDESRLTVGSVSLAPNFPHSIAGEAVFSIIGRDPDEETMRLMADACRETIERVARGHGLVIETAERSWLPPTALDRGVADHLFRISQELGLPTRRMISGAGHDAQTFARHLPAGLIFVPSTGGISHSPAEHTTWSDVRNGATVLAHAIARAAMT